MARVWLFGAAAVLLMGVISWMLGPVQADVLRLQLAFTPRTFGEIIHGWSAAELLRYRQHLVVDGALLLAYAGFGHSLATRSRLFAAAGQIRARVARGCLPLAAACDAVENGLHLWLTATPRFGLPALYATSASLSLLKWLLFIGFAGLVAHALVHDDG